MIFAFGCTKSWYKYLVISLFSLLRTNKNTKKIYLLLETNNIDDVPNLRYLVNKYGYVEFVLINFKKERNKYVTKDNPNVDTVYTDFAFCKLVLADYVKEDRVIYLDTDAIVTKDITRLWEWDIDDYYVAGCKDLGVINSSYFKKLNIDNKYINTGMMLLNLNKIREDNIIPEIFKILNERELLYPDQDAFNLVCTKKTTYVPSIYNHAYCITKQAGNIDSVKIWHFAGPKEQWVVELPYSEIWYDIEEEFYFELKNQ
ncbi:MAG: glycosyltransferase family 8 protein [Candidatus Coprovivens sp.]